MLNVFAQIFAQRQRQVAVCCGSVQARELAAQVKMPGGVRHGTIGGRGAARSFRIGESSFVHFQLKTLIWKSPAELRIKRIERKHRRFKHLRQQHGATKRRERQ